MKKNLKHPNITLKGAIKRTKLNSSRRKETIKIRVEINEIETNKTIEKISQTKSWFFVKINKIDKPLDLSREKERGLK